MLKVMMKKAILVLWFGCLSTGTVFAQTSPLSTNGITVGQPKIYDNYYLQGALNKLRDQLAGLRVVDQTTLLSHIGQAQGANLQQLGFAFQGAGPSTPSISTFSPAPGVAPFSSTGSPTATTPGTTTATTSLAPSTASPAATTLAVPTIGQSSLDTLNESMQLSAAITGYQLLLNGALSDQQMPSGDARTVFTVGFPVTISPPDRGDEDDMANSIAEVRVAICGPQDPSIVTLLPQERTYNVASLLDHSLAASIGSVLGGVFSIGGGFLWHHQTYYLVQQQETVALQLPVTNCPNALPTPASFTWQIHPVLGKKFVRPGIQYDFVQISVPSSLVMRGGEIANACLEIGWRKTADHGNRLDDELTDAKSSCFELKAYTADPTIRALSVSDIGSGNVWVKAMGTFPPGTSIRIGSKLLFNGAVGISADWISLSFAAAASDIATAGGVALVSRESEEIPLLQPRLPASEKAAHLPSAPLQITNVQIEPYSATHSLITVDYLRPTGPNLPFEPCIIPGAVSPPPCIPGDPYLARIGTAIYGLSDSPYLSMNATQVRFLAANDSIAGAPQLELMRLLWPSEYYAVHPLHKDAVTVGKATLLASAPVLQFSLTGSNLNRAKLVYPDCQACLTPTGSSFATISLDPDKMATKLDASSLKSLKQVIICNAEMGLSGCDAKFAPVVLAIPTADADASKSSKPKLEDHDPLPIGTTVVTIKGTALEQIASIRVQGTTIPYRLSLDKKPALVVQLPVSVASTKGQYILWIELTDKTTLGYVINIGTPDKS
jgi:hypothetical protein